MLFEINGLVIREAAYGESHKMLTLLTAERGKISVCAYGVRSIRNHFMHTAQLLCYNEYVINEKSGRLRMTEAAVIEDFHELRDDLGRFALGQYTADVANEICVEGEDCSEILRLILNTLYMLTTKTKPEAQIKGAFELRSAALSGFMPILTACSGCGDIYPDTVYFDIMGGVVRCPDCFEKLGVEEKYYENGKPRANVLISRPVYEALRYTVTAPQERLFAFHLDGPLINEYAGVCEMYLLSQLERSFPTLEFYHKICIG